MCGSSLAYAAQTAALLALPLSQERRLWFSTIKTFSYYYHFSRRLTAASLLYTTLPANLNAYNGGRGAGTVIKASGRAGGGTLPGRRAM